MKAIRIIPIENDTKLRLILYYICVCRLEGTSSYYACPTSLQNLRRNNVRIGATDLNGKVLKVVTIQVGICLRLTINLKKGLRPILLYWPWSHVRELVVICDWEHRTHANAIIQYANFRYGVRKKDPQQR